MRVYHVLMLVMGVIAEADESVSLQLQKGFQSDEKPLGGNEKILYVDDTSLLQHKSTKDASGSLAGNPRIYLTGGNQNKKCLDEGPERWKFVRCGNRICGREKVDGGIKCTHDSGAPEEAKFTVVHHGSRISTLQTDRGGTNNYCQAMSGKRIDCQQPTELADHTKFRIEILEKLGPKKWRAALFSVTLKKYCEDNGNRGIICNRDAVGGHEQFTIEQFN